MNERLLQYIWQFRHFHATNISTLEGEPLVIIQPGEFNFNQGPDFLSARIVIGQTTWVGHVELHIRSSDWKNHHHDEDINYRNVILHVVWKHDIDLKLPFPTLVLEDKVSKLLLKKYDEMMINPGFIPCGKHIRGIGSLVWQSWTERLMIERLEDRSRLIFQCLEQNQFHWEETFWWMIAGNFGIRVNRSAFEAVARSIPLPAIARHRKQVNQVEALLFGQANLLGAKFSEDYPAMLKKEYQFLKKKYGLIPINEPIHFLRMRPSNFPSVRLAQLAMLIHQSEQLFSRIRETSRLAEVKALFDLTANDYWHYHYIFDELTAFRPKHLGNQMTENILINTIIPMLFAYGQHQGMQPLKERALDWLSQMPAELNTISQGFSRLGIPIFNAFDSQACIQLKKQYCDCRRCLECGVGAKLLGKENE